MKCVSTFNCSTILNFSCSPENGHMRFMHGAWVTCDPTRQNIGGLGTNLKMAASVAGSGGLFQTSVKTTFFHPQHTESIELNDECK